MSYYGDIRLEDTIDVKFTSRRFSTGAPFTLAGTPVISAYIGNSITQLTAGITLTVDFDAVTGLNNVRVAATAVNGYAAATNVELVITVGTVDGVSVVGEVVASFSIEARSALMPTTVARKLVVDAAGLADANVVKLGPTGTGTAQTARDVGGNVDVATSTRMATYAQPTGFLAAAFPLTVASTTNITAGVITTTTNLTTNNDKTGYGLSAAAVQAVWDAATTALTTVGSAGKLVVDNLNATVSSRLASASYTTPPTAVENADSLLARNVSGGSSAGRTVKQALHLLRNRTNIAAGTLTVYDVDDITASFTAAVTTTAGDPISQIDPA